MIFLIDLLFPTELNPMETNKKWPFPLEWHGIDLNRFVIIILSHVWNYLWTGMNPMQPNKD
jgi:hypothetical protein